MGKYCGFNYTYSCKGDLPPPRAVAANHTIYFCFSLCVFFGDSFEGERVHGTCQGEEVCDGWIPVDVRSGHRSCSQEDSLMVGSWWRLESGSDQAIKKVLET